MHVADHIALRSLPSCDCVVSCLRACGGFVHAIACFLVVSVGVPVGRSGPVVSRSFFSVAPFSLSLFSLFFPSVFPPRLSILTCMKRVTTRADKVHLGLCELVILFCFVLLPPCHRLPMAHSDSLATLFCWIYTH